jgi:hypothetical protein
MTKSEADAILDNIALNGVIPAARMIQVLREWKAAGLDAEAAVSAFEGLRPGEAMEVMTFARRKAARRHRPR